MLAECKAQQPIIDSLCAFESKLLSLFPASGVDSFKCGEFCIGLEKQGAGGGEITLSLLAQEMRDFCLLDRLPLAVLERFVSFLLPVLEAQRCTRIRFGPLSRNTGQTLCALFRGQKSNFIFENVVLSVEPLLDKSLKIEATKKSLKRALRNMRSAGLTHSSDSFSACEMRTLHEQRWGKNRSAHFFELMRAFVDEPYCESVSIKDPTGVLVAQQIDFCFVDERYYYYSIRRQGEHTGLGTALLAESIRRFWEEPRMRIYSLGRGGEAYKYRYAPYVRLNYYLAGFRTNDAGQWQ